MYEMNGLRVIVTEAVEHGTIHCVRLPPAREDFRSDDEHAAAHRKWWDTMHLWSATITNVAE